MEAADALTAWLDGIAATAPRPAATPAADPGSIGEAISGAREGASGQGDAVLPPARPRIRADTVDTRDGNAVAGEVLQLANPDWLEHRLAVTGPVEEIARFRAAAAGPGVIPWQVDLDGAEEDFFHRLVAPPAPHKRVLSAAGARIVAAELRDAMQRQRALALALAELARDGQACPFDLHALLPVPGAVLTLGPDHPDALAWLWAHWGPTRGLRRVDVIQPPRSRKRPQSPEGAAAVPEPWQGAWHLGFWSADWTPWRALRHLAELWPALHFQAQPLYDHEGGGA